MSRGGGGGKIKARIIDGARILLATRIFPDSLTDLPELWEQASEVASERMISNEMSVDGHASQPKIGRSKCFAVRTCVLPHRKTHFTSDFNAKARFKRAGN